MLELSQYLWTFSGKMYHKFTLILSFQIYCFRHHTNEPEIIVKSKTRDCKKKKKKQYDYVKRTQKPNGRSFPLSKLHN